MPELMKARGLNQADFSRLIGLSEGFVSKVISLEKKFSIIKGRRAARLLKCTIDELWEWED